MRRLFGVMLAVGALAAGAVLPATAGASKFPEFGNGSCGMNNGQNNMFHDGFFVNGASDGGNGFNFQDCQPGPNH